MRTHKKITAMLTGLLAVCTLAACSGASSAGAKHSEDERPLVLTTFTVIQDMAGEVAGDHLRIESITKPGEEIHDFQPSPDDIKRGADAQLILENGLGLERWFKKFTANSKAEAVTLSEGIEPVLIAEGDHKGEPNPHAWMSPENAKVYIDNLVKAFSKIDSEHAADFAKNGEAYKAKLDEISTQMRSKLDILDPAQRALVTCEGAFSYLTRDYNLSEHYLWAVNAEGALTPERVATVYDYVKNNKVPAVYCESTVEGKMTPIVEGTDAVYGGTLYVDSLTEANGDAPTYLDLLRYDTQIITDGLTGVTAQKAPKK